MPELTVQEIREAALILRSRTRRNTNVEGSAGLIKGEQGLYLTSVAHNLLDRDSGEVDVGFEDGEYAYFWTAHNGQLGLARALQVHYTAPCEIEVTPTADYMILEVVPYGEVASILEKMDASMQESLSFSFENLRLQMGSRQTLKGDSVRGQFLNDSAPDWYLDDRYALDLNTLQSSSVKSLNANMTLHALAFAGIRAAEQTGEDYIRRPEIEACRLDGVEYSFGGEESSFTYRCGDSTSVNDYTNNTSSPGSSGGLTAGTHDGKSAHLLGVSFINQVNEDKEIYKGGAVSIDPILRQIRAIEAAREAGAIYRDAGVQGGFEDAEHPVCQRFVTVQEVLNPPTTIASLSER